MKINDIRQIIREEMFRSLTEEDPQGDKSKVAAQAKAKGLEYKGGQPTTWGPPNGKATMIDRDGKLEPIGGMSHKSGASGNDRASVPLKQEPKQAMPKIKPKGTIADPYADKSPTAKSPAKAFGGGPNDKTPPEGHGRSSDLPDQEPPPEKTPSISSLDPDEYRKAAYAKHDDQLISNLIAVNKGKLDHELKNFQGFEKLKSLGKSNQIDPDDVRRAESNLAATKAKLTDLTAEYMKRGLGSIQDIKPVYADEQWAYSQVPKNTTPQSNAGSSKGSNEPQHLAALEPGWNDDHYNTNTDYTPNYDPQNDHPSAQHKTGPSTLEHPKVAAANFVDLLKARHSPQEAEKLIKAGIKPAVDKYHAAKQSGDSAEVVKQTRNLKMFKHALDLLASEPDNGDDSYFDRNPSEDDYKHFGPDQ